MSLTDKINADIKTAMLAKEKDKLEALRAIKAALLLESTKGGSTQITPEIEVKILHKLYKQRVESADIFKQQSRNDLADAEMFQADIIKTYLPEQLNEEQIKAAVKEIIDQVGAKTAADMPKVMGPVMQKLSGKAEGKLISAIVKQMLS
ncbi:MAG TPA: GatB/YqeY domain-containing protein [Flavobacteriales bacterium]|nr:GatB/YqeY domain-containing protein [Flavobacteriales bacterium]